MTDLRIGVLDLRSAESTSSGTYSRMIMQSLLQAAAEHPEISIHAITSDAGSLPAGIKALSDIDTSHQSAYRRIKRRLLSSIAIRSGKQFPSLPDPAAWWLALNKEIDIILPACLSPDWDCGIPIIGWIPDFQHKHYPEFFDDRENQQRDRQFNLLSDHCTRIILSSYSALKDYQTFQPLTTSKASVHPFPSAFAFNAPEAEPAHAIRKYHIPEKYLLVVNQLWSHKNHMVVIRALGLLKKAGLRPCVVFSGLPSDYRDLINKNLSLLFQEVSKLDVQDQVIFLGHIPYYDLASLLRSCACLIQPSLFEGWNTSIQDAIALGKPVICSSIAVHREQAPHALGFFDPHSSEELAELIGRHWDRLKPGYNRDQEETSLTQHKAFARTHGKKLLNLCTTIAASRKSS
jgi:glycosyltransferase involved in cell wall biosynthesis